MKCVCVCVVALAFKEFVICRIGGKTGIGEKQTRHFFVFVKSKLTRAPNIVCGEDSGEIKEWILERSGYG